MLDEKEVAVNDQRQKSGLEGRYIDCVMDKQIIIFSFNENLMCLSQVLADGTVVFVDFPKDILNAFSVVAMIAKPIKL